MAAAASRDHDRVVVAGLAADVEQPGTSAALVTGGVTVLVVRGDDGVLRAFTGTCRHRHPLVVAERAAPGMVAAGAFTCPFAGWPEPHDGSVGMEGGVRPLAVAAAYGVVLVRPGGDEPIDVEALIDAEIARRLGDLGLEHVECVHAARELVARDGQTVVDELGARPGTVAVAGHAVVEPVADGVEVTRVFALAHGEGCVVDRRRYRVRA